MIAYDLQPSVAGLNYSSIPNYLNVLELLCDSKPQLFFCEMGIKLLSLSYDFEDYTIIMNVQHVPGTGQVLTKMLVMIMRSLNNTELPNRSSYTGLPWKVIYVILPGKIIDS